MKSVIKMGITRNDKQTDGSFKRVFTTDINFTVNYDEFLRENVRAWTDYGFKVMLQSLLRKFAKKEDVTAWVNKHSGIITPSAIEELAVLKAPPKDPQVAYINKVSKLEGEAKDEEITRMIKQLQEMQGK